MHEGDTLHSCADYARQLRPSLPAELFQRNPLRLLWLPAHLTVIALAVTVLLAGDLAWGWRILVSAILGHSYGCLTFLAHEILHGTVVKNARLQNVLGGI